MQGELIDMSLGKERLQRLFFPVPLWCAKLNLQRILWSGGGYETPSPPLLPFSFLRDWDGPDGDPWQENALKFPTEKRRRLSQRLRLNGRASRFVGDSVFQVQCVAVVSNPVTPGRLGREAVFVEQWLTVSVDPIRWHLGSLCPQGPPDARQGSSEAERTSWRQDGEPLEPAGAHFQQWTPRRSDENSELVFKIEVELIYNAVLFSGVQQSDSVYLCIFVFTFFPS